MNPNQVRHRKKQRALEKKRLGFRPPPGELAMSGNRWNFVVAVAVAVAVAAAVVVVVVFFFFFFVCVCVCSLELPSDKLTNSHGMLQKSTLTI